jgi:DNA-binding response OmpR family regulator
MTIATSSLVLADDLGEIHFRSTRLVLRRAEFNVLHYLLQQYPRVVSAREVLAQVLGSNGDGGTVRTHVWEIRRKLTSSALPLEIQTIRCRGYRARVDERAIKSFDIDLTETS